MFNRIVIALILVVVLAGMAFPAFAQDEAAAESEGGERRFVFITVSFSQERADQHEGDADNGKELEEELRNRFADWYYVISGADFNALRPGRRDLL